MIENKNFDNFSIVRLVACIGILLVHLEQLIDVPQFLRPFFLEGAAGVAAFFVMSGYLGIMSYQKSINNKLSIVGWYIKKIKRILPAYYLAILLYFIAYQLVINSVPIDETHLYWSRYIFCISTLVPSNDPFWVNLGATWTVGVFLLWYLLVPIVNKYVINIKSGVIGFFICYGIEKVVEHFSGYLLPLLYLKYFMLGVILYYCIKEDKEHILAVISIVLIYVFYIRETHTITVSGLVAVAFLCVTTKLKIKNSFIRRLLSVSDLYSYDIYIMHPVMFMILIESGITGNLLIVLLFIIGTVILSLLAHFLEERIF